jgi:hypothetical protein
VSSSPHLKTEIDPISETLFPRFRNVVFPSYLQFRTMDKVQNPSDSEFLSVININNRLYKQILKVHLVWAFDCL